MVVECIVLIEKVKREYGESQESRSGRSPEPYEREGVDEHIEELSERTSLEKEKRTRDYIWYLGSWLK